MGQNTQLIETPAKRYVFGRDAASFASLTIVSGAGGGSSATHCTAEHARASGLRLVQPIRPMHLTERPAARRSALRSLLNLGWLCR